MAVMTAQSLDWRFCQSTGAGWRIFSSSRESSSFFRLCGRKAERHLKAVLSDRLINVCVCVSSCLDEVSDARRRSEDDPLVHRHRLLILVSLDGDVSSEEQQRER